MAQTAPDLPQTVYPEYFGLKEVSFSITPDPQYLYLSNQYREALAHLLYGTGGGGGFVLLTGEVGTGKTTVCRAFLEQLPEQVDVALILNPALTGPELLQTVCHEFGIELPVGETSTKVLIDRLNAYLLDAHAKGRRPLLMIDEAQNLAPEVLEQVRLLTNLETPKHKLLQIFLVGQPELRELLRGERLRQLDQRITARFHITPLGKTETADYIRHRLAVAGVERRLFTPAANRQIYRLSGGVPRLINILCDRALLGAYATRSNLVNSRIVTQAARELRGEQGFGGWAAWRRTFAAIALAVPLAAGIGWLAYAWMQQQTTNPVPPAEVVAAPAESASAAATSPDEPIGPAEQTKEREISAQTRAADEHQPAPPEAETHSEIPPLDALLSDRRTALTRLLHLWRVEVAEGVSADLCKLAETAGLRCRGDKGTWNNLRAYGRPAMIELRDPGGKTGYVVVVGLDEGTVTLVADEKNLQVPIGTLDSHWYGNYLLLWRPPPTGGKLIAANAPAESIRWLRKALTRVDGVAVSDLESGLYDQGLRAAVQQFQAQRGLEPDGIAGPETLIQLNNAAAAPDTPRLITSP